MKKLISSLIIIAALLFRCSPSGPDMSGTSEQGNARVTAVISTSDKKPASGATVRLRRADYTKDIVLNKQSSQAYSNLLTNQNGSFFIDSLDTGSYVIEVTDNYKEAVLLYCSITEKSQGPVNLGSDTLRPFATIKGKVDYNTVNDRRFAKIVGLERLAEVSVDGFYSFSDLPPGSYTVNVISIDPAISPIVHKNVVTLSGQVTLTPYQGWLYSKPVYLNTTSTGAAIFDNVNNFPVLVRLNSSNFKFNEAKANGEDLHFIKPGQDSIPFPFEIERWDVETGAAEIWVKVDTVYRNSTTRSFLMLWGNSDAQKAKQSGSVFDTSNGFGGTWHLSDQDSALTPDATQNKFNGTAVHVENCEGIIGRASSFTPNNSYITIANTANGKLNFPVNGHYSISAWVRSDSVDQNRIIISKGDVQYYLKIHNFNWHFAEYHDLPGTGWDFISAPYSFNNWVHLYCVRNDTSQYLYVNGTCIDSSKSLMGGTVSRNESFNVEIGRRLLPDNTDGQYFSGIIDEARICTVSRNSNWIKLSYMNQRVDNVLVQF